MTFVQRFFLTTGAAAAGNIVSSAIFVPKEFLKQQLQYHAGNSQNNNLLSLQHVVRDIWQQHGLRGMYRGYQATLLRNIPTAALRFVIYEELKWMLAKRQARAAAASASSSKSVSAASHTTSSSWNVLWKHFGAGGIAGAAASFVMTPTDVLKTRLSTGQCPIEDVPSCLGHIWQTTGWAGLYAGAGSRVVFAAAFSSIGFGTLELVKQWLNVPYKNYQEYCQHATTTTTTKTGTTGSSKKR